MARRNKGSATAGIIALLAFVAFCGKLAGGGSESGDDYSTPLSVYTPPSGTYSPSSTVESSPETTGFYAHDAINVRTGPGKDNGTVRTLARGDYMRLGSKDASGWAPLYDSSGVREGYVYRASGAVRTSPPAARSTASSSRTRTTSRASSASSSGYYTGPRGGCYTYSSSGRKRYVDRSYCN
jgi:hypothetical protein